MNSKQTVPLIATIATAAPPLLIAGAIGCGIYYTLKWLFSDDDEENKPETVPADVGAERRRKEAETSAFRQIPAEIQVKPAVAPAPVVMSPPSVKIHSPAPVPAAIATPKIVMQAPPLPPIKKKFVTREDIAAIFHHGARPLTRTAAVAALKRFGFGKTAAYAALSPDGRFADWLRVAPDGVITWTD